MKLKKIRPSFVELIPDQLEDGILYISITYCTATHKCACGCGEHVVTPVTPTDWMLTWNGDAITMYPSIGNWNFPCQSHYWIRQNKIVWDKKWSKSKIEFGRRMDRKAKAHYFSL